ncbi:hypothetical protein B0F88_10684 [Methylobacter tundripaludum]|uniref:Uncharacterized protein n=1 Tax=Methylobacter tundripaludum TaxID=173365 RepID=A0A2S6H2M6_9GAMM|nr:hypothetical protein B0F88_10684 [Methylobacter tundripaludum]
MFRLIDIVAFHRILVDVIRLLAHNHLGFNDLRMTACFPNLIGSVLFMGTFKKRQQLQQLSRMTLFQMRNDLLRRVRFESLYIMA